MWGLLLVFKFQVRTENLLTFDKTVCVQPTPAPGVYSARSRVDSAISPFPSHKCIRPLWNILNDIRQQLSRPPVFFHEPQVLTRCPKCLGAYLSKVKCESCASCCVSHLCPGSHQSGTTESHRSNQRVEDGSSGISGGHHQQSGASLKLKSTHKHWECFWKCALLQLCLWRQRVKKMTRLWLFVLTVAGEPWAAGEPGAVRRHGSAGHPGDGVQASGSRVQGRSQQAAVGKNHETRNQETKGFRPNWDKNNEMISNLFHKFLLISFISSWLTF